MADQRFRGGVVDLARCRQDRVEFLEAMAAIVALVFVGWHLKTSFYNNFRQRGMPCRTDRSALKDDGDVVDSSSRMRRTSVPDETPHAQKSDIIAIISLTAELNYSSALSRNDFGVNH